MFVCTGKRIEHIALEWRRGQWNTPGGHRTLVWVRRTTADAQQDTDEDTEPLHDTGEDTEAHQDLVADTESLDTRTPWDTVARTRQKTGV